MKNFCFFLFLIPSLINFAQVNSDVKIRRDTIKNSKSFQSKSDSLNTNRSSKNSNQTKKKKTSIQDYLIISQQSDTTFIDTTLTLKKDYKFNYLQKDDFGLMPFANIGQTYNSLTYNFSYDNSLPVFGARARHFNYLESNDIHYYEVPTPWTRLTYKTAFEQGQMLDAFFTVNLSKQFNFSLAYKGLRSLGNYQHVLTSSGNFRATTNYKSKNNRYNIKAHFVSQDLLNEENGGLSNDDVVNFVSGAEDFLDRSVFDPNFQNAESKLLGKRFYVNQSYGIINKNDSIQNNKLSLANSIFFEDKNYQYKQDTSLTSFFGDAFTTSINDQVTLEHFKAQIGLNYFNSFLGRLNLALNYTDINYGYDSVVVFPEQRIPNRIKTNFIGVNAQHTKTFKNFKVYTKGGLNLSNDLEGHYLNSTLDVKLNDDINVNVGIHISSKLPNYNYLLNQSDYVNYNWYNLDAFKPINTQQINLGIKSENYFNAFLDISNIDNHTFFNLNETTTEGTNIIKPTQYNKTLQYLRVKLQKEIKVGHFALDNTIMYQNVVSDEEVLNVPQIVTRNTLYYSNQLFKKAMTFQTGVTFNYFSKYKMNGYDPLLTEFYTQNTTELGGFPRLDFFINAKIRQTRIFLKAEHFNSSFTGYDYFSAPNNPYRDFTIRFGLVWDFFL